MTQSTLSETVRLRQHIGGWQDTDTVLQLHDPADSRRPVATVPSASRQEVQHAIAAASRGFQTWSRTPIFERCAIIEAASGLIAERSDSLAEAITLEMGKPIRESRAEVQRAVEHARYFATAGRRPDGTTSHLGSINETAFTLRAPIGVVATINPWNFPVMIPNWKLAGALAHGNAVVFKPAEISPVSASLLTQAYLDAGVPPDVLSLVLGKGSVVGPTIIESTQVAGVSFTGSTAVGLTLASDAARTGKRSQVEMGGKNALVVMPDGDLDEAVQAIMVGGFGTSGQRCTSSSRILVHRSVSGELQERLEAQIDALVIGPGLEESTTLGPMASEQALQDAMEGLMRAVEGGASVVRGGRRLTDGEFEHGWFIEPTLLTADTSGPAFHEELFGPIVSLHEFDTLDEAIELNNAVVYGLSASIYTRDLSAAHRFIRETDTGMVHVNRPTVGAEPHLPFGGAKASALGSAELGAAVDFFTKTRAAHLRWPS